MNITFKVDQAAALKAGINAPSSTTKVDIDPAELSQEEREYLSSILSEGHDCTKYGLSAEGLKVSGATGDYSEAPVLVRPDLQGVRDAIAERLRQRAAHLEKHKQENADRARKADSEIDAAIASAATRHVRVKLDESGLPTETSAYYSGISVDLSVPCIYACRDYASDAAKERYAAEVERRKAEAARLIAATQPELERLHADAAASEAATRAEYDALYARLPEKLRKRAADGFASDDEIKKGIQLLIRSDAGYKAHEDWERCRILEVLTDAQYERLLEAKAGAPNGAKVTPMRVWDVKYRPAEEDEGGDRDGEVAVEVNMRSVALIEWSRGDIETNTAVSLDKESPEAG
jgi:hypothetical protein